METNVSSVKLVHGKKCLSFKFLLPQAPQAAPGLQCQLTERLCKYAISIAAPCSCSTGPLPEQALQGELWGRRGEGLLPVEEGSKIGSCLGRLDGTCLQMLALKQASL